MTKKFVTTSIAYINAEPHIGFLLELVAADVLARFYRLQGADVFFLTGTDEHGLKIQQAAAKAGQEPQQFADQVAAKFQALTKDFNISNDFFVRTTDPGHFKFIQEIWQKLSAAGVLEKQSYTGLYCTGCEAFKTEREVVDGKCIIHETEVEEIAEENWFLVLNDELKQKISAWLPAIYPSSKQHEVANALKEIDKFSFSRPKDKLSWGIPVPGDEDQTMYVWVDALFNYISGVQLSSRKIEDWWPADVQLIGKDILKFHAIIWPAMLVSLGYDLPKQLLVHGFINVEGKKLSKSTGNIVTPKELSDRYGVDASRYLLLRQLNFYDDSNFVWTEFDALYNGELANGVGNLVARIVGLLKKINHPITEEIHVGSQTLAEFDFAAALHAINNEVNAADQAVSGGKLWENITGDKEHQEKLIELGQKVAALADLLEPFTPTTAKEIRRQLAELDPKPLFPRLDTKPA